MGENLPHRTFLGTVRSLFRHILKPRFIQEWRQIWKEDGFYALVKKKGWKIVVAIVLFYLIRDGILYILIPYLAYRGLVAD